MSDTPLAKQKFFIVGGAGFIGSHFCDHLLGAIDAAAVTIYDNFSSGRDWHHAHHARDRRFRVVRAEVEDTPALTAAMAGHDVVIHLASNPDIARAATELGSLPATNRITLRCIAIGSAASVIRTPAPRPSPGPSRRTRSRRP